MTGTAPRRQGERSHGGSQQLPYQPVYLLRVGDRRTAGYSINPIALNYMKLYPEPNNTVGVGADGADNYISNAPSVDKYNEEFGRMDYNVTAKDHFFFDFRTNVRSQVKEDYFGNGTQGSTLIRHNLGSTFEQNLNAVQKAYLDQSVSRCKPGYGPASPPNPFQNLLPLNSSFNKSTIPLQDLAVPYPSSVSTCHRRIQRGDRPVLVRSCDVARVQAAHLAGSVADG